MTTWDLHEGDVVEWAESYRGEKFHAALMDCPYEYAFMNRGWDGAGVSFQPKTWAAIGKHLHPGAFAMTFAGPRTMHRVAVAIEDAGLILHPILFLWTFGSGFPKATRIDTQEEADEATWQGHRYGLQALKPAAEPILLFQKPYQNRPIEDMVATGAGALNIGEARVGVQPEGRWPSNFVLCHHPGCVYVGGKEIVGITGGGGLKTPGEHGMETIADWQCHPDCAVRRLGEQTGERKAGGKVTGNEPSSTGQNHIYNLYNRVENHPYDDTGTAARFFFQADWSHEVAEQLARADAVHYCAKASRSERDAGLSTFGARITNDGRASSIDNPYQRGDSLRHNPHPTVKPLSLVKHLASLLAPPAAYAPRRLLVPFAGVGSEMCGALLSEQWEHVVGIELNDHDFDAIAIANARCQWWANESQWGCTDPAAILQGKRVATSQDPEQQLTFF